MSDHQLPATRTQVDSVLPDWFINRFVPEPTVLELMFQPIVALPSRRVVGFEALLRWFDMDNGFISNGAWIPEAERAQLMPHVDQWVMVAVVHAAAEMQMYHPTLGLSVNVTPDNLTPEMAESAAQLARELELAPSSLTFEVTETAAALNPRLAERTVNDLRHAGFRVSLDDFGTGHSSLTHLMDLPVSTVKLDRGFVAKLHTKKGRAFANYLLGMSKDMGLDCVAEGIETEEQEAQLVSMGYEYAQGFLYGHAEPLSKSVELVTGSLNRS